MKAEKEEKLYGANRKAGEDFLAANAKQPGVTVLPSGLQYKVLTKGTGEVPKISDEVIVKYEGKLIDGTVFDSSYERKEQTNKFRPSQVIKGWTEALTLMPVGSKWQIFVPQELAYGSREAGKIKPFSALIFTVELVGIEKAK
jgi:FKBP-type peptidyl-prolyl cis-trans isomerase FklB